MPAVIGPVFEEHALIFPVPEIVQLSEPVGATELLAPVVVAVKVRFPPRVAAPDGVITNVGVAMETTVEVEEAVPETELYAPPTPILNIAE